MQFEVFDLGLIRFQDAWQKQKDIFGLIKDRQLESALIFCRHYPVITLGRQGKKENILAAQEELKAKGIEVFATERGGDVTYHGPGQLTLYPIFNLNYLKKDIHWFLRQMEEIIINSLAELNIFSQCRSGLTGVWCGNQKIASIGIAIRNWITFHGLSINIKEDDLANFSLIRPCGMDIEMTSAETVLNKRIEIQDIKEIVLNQFRDTLSAHQEAVPCFKSNEA